MGRSDDHLLPDEHVVHRARLHWVIFGQSIALMLVGAGAAGLLYAQFAPERYWLAGMVLAGLGAVLAIGPALRAASSEFVVTDKRVLAKYGLVRRQSLETLLSKVEAIGVSQDVLGRLLGYGTITITGTGGTHEALPTIADPLEFRRQVQAQMVVLEERRAVAVAAAAPSPSQRIERECPYCAEPILAKAKVCKHCGRAVA